jgi:phosphomannomutase
MMQQLVSGTLMGLGIDVVDIGLTTTPTAEMAVTHHKAHGGIILTASHNPKQWNALKLLNEKGEFLSASDGDEVLRLSENPNIDFKEVSKIGKLQNDAAAY